MDTVLGIASVVAAVVAALAAVVSALVAHLTLKEALSPRVIAYVYTPEDSPRAFTLRVENIGGGPAWDVSVSLDALTVAALDGRSRHLADFMVGGCPFLPPGGWRETPLGYGPEFFEAMGDRDGNATVRYAHRKGGRAKERTFPVEARSFHGQGRDREVGHLARMDESLRAIAKALGGR